MCVDEFESLVVLLAFVFFFDVFPRFELREPCRDPGATPDLLPTVSVNFSLFLANKEIQRPRVCKLIWIS